MSIHQSRLDDLPKEAREAITAYEWRKLKVMADKSYDVTDVYNISRVLARAINAELIDPVPPHMADCACLKCWRDNYYDWID